MQSIYFSVAILLLVYVSFWYVIALLKKDNSVADIAWGLGFPLVAWWVYLRFGSVPLPAFLVTVWGLRLAVHISVRNLGTGEDWRYRKWRQEWGRWFYLRSYLQVFLLQGFLLWVITLPLMYVDFPDKEISLLKMGWVLPWAIGFWWEAVADWQLAAFKKKEGNKGKIMTSGLWALSRHPNYFGEILMWWAMFFLVFDFTALSSYHNWLLLLSPVTITWLLTRVSGVPMLEEKYKGNPSYQKYVRETNGLLPDLRKWLR